MDNAIKHSIENGKIKNILIILVIFIIAGLSYVTMKATIK